MNIVNFIFSEHNLDDFYLRNIALSNFLKFITVSYVYNIVRFFGLITINHMNVSSPDLFHTATVHFLINILILYIIIACEYLFYNTLACLHRLKYINVLFRTLYCLVNHLKG